MFIDISVHVTTEYLLEDILRSIWNYFPLKMLYHSFMWVDKKKKKMYYDKFGFIHSLQLTTTSVSDMFCCVIVQNGFSNTSVLFPRWPTILQTM